MSYLNAIVICRRASDPVPARSLPGYQCKVCNEELVATPTGRRMIAEGGTPYCNKHGFQMAEEAEAAGLAGPMIMSAEAGAALERIVERMRSGS
jgi:hypothetical protein